MAFGNYSLVANTQFKARSFDDLIRPYAMYTQEYRAQEDAIADLATKADVWQGLANEQTDPVAYAQYTNYANALKEQANVIADRGLDPSSRQAMLNLKRRYASEIVPMEQAYNWRLQQIQQQAEGKAKGVVYEGDAATTSLDKYLANPTLIYNAADSNAGYTRLANAAQAIAKGLSEAKISGRLDNYTKALLIRSGYDVNDVTNSVNQAMSDLQGVLNGTISMNSRAGKVVQELLHNESKAAGIGEWDNRQAQQEYLSKVSPALYNLIGPSQTTPIEDVKARSDLQLSNTIAAQNNQGRIASQEADKDRAFKASLYGGKYDPKTGTVTGITPKNSPSAGSGAGRSGTEYKYDRHDVAYSEGEPKAVAFDQDTKQIMIDGKAKDRRADLFVTRSPRKPSVILFKYENKVVAQFDTDREHSKVIGDPSAVIWWDPERKKYLKSPGDLELRGILEGVTAADIRLMADQIAANPGSENQYSFGVTTDGEIYSIQNSAQRMTKGLNASAALMQSLWTDMGYDTPDSGTSDQDSNLNLW